MGWTPGQESRASQAVGAVLDRLGGVKVPLTDRVVPQGTGVLRWVARISGKLCTLRVVPIASMPRHPG